MLYSTRAAEVLVSLLLDSNKVNVENLTVIYFWLIICWWYLSFLQYLSKNVRFSVDSVNTYVSTFSFSIKLLLGENTFLRNIFGRLPRVDILQKAIQKVFKKFLRKHPWSLKKVFLLMMLQTLYLKLYKTTMFHCKSWEFFR